MIAQKFTQLYSPRNLTVIFSKDNISTFSATLGLIQNALLEANQLERRK
jgi:hypothetical protein